MTTRDRLPQPPSISAACYANQTFHSLDQGGIVIFASTTNVWRFQRVILVVGYAKRESIGLNGCDARKKRRQHCKSWRLKQKRPIAREYQEQ